MSKIFILNGHQPYPFAKGRLNATLEERAKTYLEAQGHDVRVSRVAEAYDVDAEVENHIWADVVIMQFPVNWMMTPWSMKKYMDEVYTAGMDGRLTTGDGRTADAPKAKYGMGGSLAGTKYMLSVTFNAPSEAFDDPAEGLFKGAGVDDLLAPMHFNARFFAMEALPTYAAYDVMKNADIDAVLTTFDAHMNAVFPAP